MRKQDGKLPLIESQQPTTNDQVEITPGGIAVTGGNAAEVNDKATSSVIRGPWQPGVEPSAPGNTSEAVAAMATTWSEYCEWRKTKCPPPEFRGAVWLDELDQAIHEMIGEMGELTYLMTENGPFFMANDPEVAKIRRHLEDEIGDLIFTTSWVFDCIDPSFFGTRGRIVEGFLPSDQREAVRATYDDIKRLNLSPGILNQLHKAPDEVQSIVMFWLNQVNGTLLTMFSNAGLISNRFKKIRWHRISTQNGNPFYDQAQNLFMLMVGLDAICTLTGISMTNAVYRNRVKLDQRFPDGWKPGGGKR